MVEITNKIFDLKDFRQYSDTLIETGTSMGDGVQRAIDAGFTNVLSIEADKKLFDISYKRFQDYPQVAICSGESTGALKHLLVFDTAIVFFLDAHPAGVGTYQHEQWIKTKENFQHNTIVAELEIILKHYDKHIILIDDMRGLDDWSQIYIDMIRKVNDQYNFYFYDSDIYKDKILAAIP